MSKFLVGLCRDGIPYTWHGATVSFVELMNEFGEGLKHANCSAFNPYSRHQEANCSRRDDRLDPDKLCSDLSSAHASCVTAGKLLNPSVPQCPHLQNGNDNSEECCQK